MVEIYASIGDDGGGVRSVAEDTERFSKIVDEPKLTVVGTVERHWLDFAEAGQVTVVLLGKIFSERDDGKYRKFDSDGQAKRLLQRYKERGHIQAESLNGEFAVMIADGPRGVCTVITDRLGRIPIYQYEDTGSAVRVTTNIQLLASDPELTPRFHLDYLSEFFCFQRSFGVRTPIRGAEQFHPASSTRIKYSGEHAAQSVYWKPHYEPSERPYSWFVNEFSKRLRSVFAERITSDDSPGLLLSGGSDSRLLGFILRGQFSGDIVGFHMNERRNVESTTAAKIASELNIEYEFLRRSPDYYLKTQSLEAGFDNYTSWFHESHPAGFRDVLSKRRPLVTGLFGDIMFRGYYLPVQTVHIPGLDWTVNLPRAREAVDASEIVRHRMQEMAFNDSPPDYLEQEHSIEQILRRELKVNGDEIIDHGVHYSSIMPLFLSYYPLTNDYSRDYFASLRIGPRWSPFIDDRLIELQLMMPRRYMVQKNIINDAMVQLDRSLAKIPHSGTRVPLTWSNYIHWASDQYRLLRKKLPAILTSPTYESSGSWPNHEVLFEQKFKAHLKRNLVSTNNNQRLIDPNEILEELENESYSFKRYYPLMTILDTPLYQNST